MVAVAHMLPIVVTAFISPLQFEFLKLSEVFAIFAVIAIQFVWLGMRSLNGLGAVRKWVAIVVRLMVLLLFILIIGGARWQRVNKDLEVIVLRDVSESTAQVKDFPRKTLPESEDEWFKELTDD